ncbi:hypothetical protein HDV05_002818 [Chytridiales sp. JEL 0842]|nr:hypothetical protein HDV05_002818 [Chytridiales sp. JEL 0842]
MSHLPFTTTSTHLHYISPSPSPPRKSHTTPSHSSPSRRPVPDILNTWRPLTPMQRPSATTRTRNRSGGRPAAAENADIGGVAVEAEMTPDNRSSSSFFFDRSEVVGLSTRPLRSSATAARQRGFYEGETGKTGGEERERKEKVAREKPYERPSDTSRMSSRLKSRQQHAQRPKKPQGQQRAKSNRKDSAVNTNPKPRKDQAVSTTQKRNPLYIHHKRKAEEIHRIANLLETLRLLRAKTIPSPPTPSSSDSSVFVGAAGELGLLFRQEDTEEPKTLLKLSKDEFELLQGLVIKVLATTAYALPFNLRSGISSKDMEIVSMPSLNRLVDNLGALNNASANGSFKYGVEPRSYGWTDEEKQMVKKAVGGIFESVPVMTKEAGDKWMQSLISGLERGARRVEKGVWEFLVRTARKKDVEAAIKDLGLVLRVAEEEEMVSDILEGRDGLGDGYDSDSNSTDMEPSLSTPKHRQATNTTFLTPQSQNTAQPRPFRNTPTQQPSYIDPSLILTPTASPQIAAPTVRASTSTPLPTTSTRRALTQPQDTPERQPKTYLIYTPTISGLITPHPSPPSSPTSPNTRDPHFALFKMHYKTLQPSDTLIWLSGFRRTPTSPSTTSALGPSLINGSFEGVAVYTIHSIEPLFPGFSKVGISAFLKKEKVSVEFKQFGKRRCGCVEDLDAVCVKCSKWMGGGVVYGGKDVTRGRAEGLVMEALKGKVMEVEGGWEGMRGMF